MMKEQKTGSFNKKKQRRSSKIVNNHHYIAKIYLSNTIGKQYLIRKNYQLFIYLQILQFFFTHIQQINKFMFERHTIYSDITECSRYQGSYPSLDYSKIIKLQQKVIKAYENEIKRLRQYAYFFEKNLKMEMLPTDEQVDEKQEKAGVIGGAVKKMNEIKLVIEGLLSKLKVSEMEQILPSVQKLQRKLSQQNEPVFRVITKEVKVPIFVEKMIKAKDDETTKPSRFIFPNIDELYKKPQKIKQNNFQNNYYRQRGRRYKEKL